MKELIKNAYQLTNTQVSVVARKKDPTNPFGYTIKDIVSDPAKALEHQIYNIEQTEFMGSDWSCYLEPWHGVGIYADAFGSKTDWPENDYPWTEPFIEEISGIANLKPMAAGESPLMMKTLETIEFFKKQTGGAIPISLTDTQSPLNTASLIVRTEELLVACHTEPEAVHCLLEQITQLIIDFSKMQLELIGKNPALPGHLFPGGGNTGIAISDDLATMVSPAIYRQFEVPYLNKISKAFGGIYLHSCGNFEHVLDPMLEIDNLLGVNMHIGQGDMNPYKAKEKLGKKCLIWADVGIKWQENYPTMERFFNDYYLPGLLSDGILTGMVVEAPWDDSPIKRKEKVNWTRDIIAKLLK